jgi:kynureninase
VAYEYVKILDYMVGSAPEYLGLAYGAIKILLVAQINNEEVKEKVKGYLEQIQSKFRDIDHLTAYMPSSRLITLIAEVYCLFSVFLRKAIKHYTQHRLSK